MIRTVYVSIRDFLRSNLIAGMFIAVPFGVTVVALVWLWGIVHAPLKQIFKVSFRTEQMPWADVGEAIQSSNYEMLLVPLTSGAIVLIAVLMLGMLTRSIIGRVAIGGVEGIVSRVPVVGMLYMSLKQLGEAFITTDGKSKFERAVAVQFPYRGAWAIGFVTGRSTTFPQPLFVGEGPSPRLLTIFVPTTPLPTAGFMIVVPENETLDLKMSVADALKMVVSGGVLNPAESQRVKDESEVTQVIRRETEIALSSAPSTGAD